MALLGLHQVSRLDSSITLCLDLSQAQMCWHGRSVDYMNDLWEWDGSTWTFRGGDTTAGGESDGGYSDPNGQPPQTTGRGWPGKRSLAAIWSSDLGILMFGGQTCTACGDITNRAKEVLSDLWLAFPDDSFTEWIWIRPAVDAEQQASVAGIGGRGIYIDGTSSSWPGARSGAAVWHHADQRANIGYMFGGLGYGASAYHQESPTQGMQRLVPSHPRQYLFVTTLHK